MEKFHLVKKNEGKSFLKHFYCYHLCIFVVSKQEFGPQWLSCLAFPNPLPLCHCQYAITCTIHTA